MHRERNQLTKCFCFPCPFCAEITAFHCGNFYPVKRLWCSTTVIFSYLFARGNNSHIFIIQFCCSAKTRTIKTSTRLPQCMAGFKDPFLMFPHIGKGSSSRSHALIPYVMVLQYIHQKQSRIDSRMQILHASDQQQGSIDHNSNKGTQNPVKSVRAIQIFLINTAEKRKTYCSTETARACSWKEAEPCMRPSYL